MIHIENLKYKYQGAKQYVFDNFSLNLEDNNIYGLLGKNGTGKSTFNLRFIVTVSACWVIVPPNSCTAAIRASVVSPSSVIVPDCMPTVTSFLLKR